MTRSEQLFKNVFSSWALSVLRTLIALLFIPYITATLGEARYGAWVIVFAALDYLALADIGLKQALVRFVARFSAEDNRGRAASAVNSAGMIYVSLAALVMALAWALIANLDAVVPGAGPELLAEARGALFVVSLQLALVFLLTPYSGALEGLQRFDLVNKQQMITELIRVVALVVLLWNGAGLVALAWVILAASLFRQIWSFMTLRRISPELRFAPRRAERDMARQLLSYSRVAFFVSMLWLVIFRADAFILGSLVGVAAAGIYAPAGQIFHYLKMFVNAIGGPLIPAVSQLEAESGREKLAALYLKGVAYVSFVTALFAVGSLFYARDFVRLWLPAEFAEAAEVLMILAPAAAIFLPQIIGDSILFGIGEHRRLLYLLIVEALLKIPLSVFLVGELGLIGLAWGSALPQAVLYGALYPRLMKRTIGVSPPRMLALFLRSTALAAFPVTLVALALGALVSPATWPGFTLHIGIILALAAPLLWWIVEKDDRARVKAALGLGNDHLKNS